MSCLDLGTTAPVWEVTFSEANNGELVLLNLADAEQERRNNTATAFGVRRQYAMPTVVHCEPNEKPSASAMCDRGFVVRIETESSPIGTRTKLTDTESGDRI